MNYTWRYHKYVSRDQKLLFIAARNGYKQTILLSAGSYTWMCLTYRHTTQQKKKNWCLCLHFFYFENWIESFVVSAYSTKPTKNYKWDCITLIIDLLERNMYNECVYMRAPCSIFPTKLKTRFNFVYFFLFLSFLLSLCVIIFLQQKTCIRRAFWFKI